jgi:gas vesicle protein
MSDENGKSAHFTLGIILGGLIGAGAVYLLGTDGGRRIQKDMVKRGRKIAGDIEDRIADLQERGQELLEQGEDLKEQITEELENRREEMTDEATKRFDTALEGVEKAQEKGLTTTQQLRKRLFKNVPKK